ncbi:MAG: DUF1273 domain-containing protein [Clostridiales bacterium]|nr:DUF1273 domain-containing protein [Clostridiales bacterium]
MPTCTFFGHRDCPDSIRPNLQKAIIRLIVQEGVDTFYVGHQGKFDRYALAALQQVAIEYPHIRYTVVLAYLPTHQHAEKSSHQADTMIPDGIETAPKRFAISRRNRWLVEHADYVIAYALYRGGAMQFVELAQKKGKKVVFVE